MVLSNVVIAALELYQLISLLLYIVNIEVVTYGTILFHIRKCKVNIVRNGPVVCVASFFNNQSHFRAGKSSRTDIFYRLRNNQCQVCTQITKGDAAKCFYGLRKFDNTDAGVLERIHANSFQFTILSKLNRRCADGIECMISNCSNIFTKFDGLYILAICSPRDLAIATIVIHRAFAAEDDTPIIMKSKVYRFASPASSHNTFISTACKLSPAKCTIYAAKRIYAFGAKAIVIEIVGVVTNTQGIRGELSARAVDNTSGFCIRCPAAVHFAGCCCLIRACRAGQSICCAVVHIGVFVVIAIVYALLVGIQYSLVAICINVICGNNDLVLVCRHVHIHALEIEGSNFKIEVGVVHDGIRLAAGGTADVVHGAVLAHLTVGHGSGAGIAVIVAGEIEVDTGRVTSRGNVLLVDLTAAGGVGVIGRDMGHQDLPGAGGLGRVLHQPLGKRLQIILVGGMVQNRDIHVATLHGVPGTGHAEHGLGRRSIVAVIRLVVADHMQDVRVADAIHSKQAQRVVPLFIIANIIDGIAQLDAEVILPSQLRGNTAHAFQCSLLLNISQQEELGLLCGGSRLEAVDLGPDSAVTHTEVVGRVSLQASQRNGIHAVDLIAGGIGDQLGSAGHLSRTAHVGAGGKLHHGAFGAGSGIAHPGDGLAVLCLCQIEADVIGRTGLVTHCVIAVQGDLEGAVALRVGCPQVHFALLGRQRGNVDLTLIIGGALQHIVGIYLDTRGGLAVLNDGNERGGLAARHSGVSLNAVHGLDGVIHQLGGEAGSNLVHLADVETIGLLAAVRASSDTHIDAVALDHRGGDIQMHSGQPVSLEGGMVDGVDLHLHHALGSVIAVCAGHALREGHRDGIVAGNGDIGRQRGDAGELFTGQRQLPLAAHSGRAGDVQLDRGQLRVVGHHIEIARLAGHVAVAVLQIEGDGVHTRAEIHQSGGAAQNILGEGAAIGTVKIEVRSLYTGGKGVGALVIVIGDEEPQITGVDRHAVLQLGLGTVVIYQLDGVHHRGGNVLIVAAVDHAHVIQQDPALQIGLSQRRAVHGRPANTVAGGFVCSRDHSAEQHTTIDADHSAGIGR